jgi:hypothetical protein
MPSASRSAPRSAARSSEASRQGLDPRTRASDGGGRNEATRRFDVRQEQRRALDEPAVALIARYRLRQCHDLCRFGYLGKTDDVGRAAHNRGEVVHALQLERIDADGDDRARLAPVPEGVGRHRPRLAPQFGRREVLEILHQDVGAALWCSVEQLAFIRPVDEQPGTAQMQRTPHAAHQASSRISITSAAEVIGRGLTLTGW